MFWEDTTMSLAFASPAQPLSLDEYWMPFTANRWFKKNPRMIERAEGVRYFTTKGDALFDFASGLWCTNAGHCHPKIVEAVQKQAATLDYSMAFTLGHPCLLYTSPSPRDS